MTLTLRFAYYSFAAAKLYGSSFYLTSDGREVEVTCVMESAEDSGSYPWPDRVSVGPVVTWLRDGAPSTSRMFDKNFEGDVLNITTHSFFPTSNCGKRNRFLVMSKLKG